MRRAIFLCAVACAHAETPAPTPVIEIEPIVPLRPAPWPVADPRPPVRATRCNASGVGMSDAEALGVLFPSMRERVARCSEGRRFWRPEMGGVVGERIERTETCAFRVVIAETTLADRATEACFANAVARAVAATPPTGVDPAAVIHFNAGDASDATYVAVDVLATALAPQREAIARCKRGFAKSFTATAWMVPTNDGARVASVGLAPVGDDDVRTADCLVDALKPMKLPSLGKDYARIVFDI